MFSSQMLAYVLGYKEQDPLTYLLSTGGWGCYYHDEDFSNE